MITWRDAQERVMTGEANALDRFVYRHEPDVMTMDEWRKDLQVVLDETRLKENIRLRTIFQDYVSFLPKEHIEELIKKLK